MTEIIQEYWLALVGGTVVGIPLTLGAIKLFVSKMFSVAVDILFKVVYKKTGIPKEDILSVVPVIGKLLTKAGGAYKQKIDWIFEYLAATTKVKIESPVYDEEATQKLMDLESRAVDLASDKLAAELTQVINERGIEVPEGVKDFIKNGVITDENR